MSANWERENFALKISELPDADEFLKWGCDAPEMLADEIFSLRAALRDLVDDCAPGPGEGFIPNAPSERTFLAALAALRVRTPITPIPSTEP